MIAAALLSGTLPGLADSGTWTGATNGTWEDSSNWSVTPYPNGTADIATFDNTSASPVVTVGAITLKQIIFKGASLDSYTISGGPITCDSSGSYDVVDLQRSVTTDQTISANFNLGGNVNNNPKFSNNSGTGRLTISGNFTNIGNGTRSMALGGSTSAVTEFSGNFSTVAGLLSMQVQKGVGIFSGTSTFNNISVTDGNRLVINGSVTSPNSVNINNQAKLEGTGSITANVAIQPNNAGAGIRPGDGSLASPAAQTGTLSVSGNVTYNSNTATAEWVFQLGGDSPGDGVGFYDQLNVGGSVALKGTNSTTALTLELVNSYTPADGSVAYLITRGDGAAFTTFFSNYAEGDPVTVGSTSGTITYQANWAGSQAGSSFTGGNDIAIKFGATTPVEPVAPSVGEIYITPAEGGMGALLTVTVTGGIPDSEIRVEASTDLGVTDPWETIGTFLLDSNGETTINDVEDAGAVGSPTDFFRIAVP